MTDDAEAHQQDYEEQLVQVIKALQQRSINDEEEIVEVGMRLNSLVFMKPIHCFQEIFK